MRGATGAARWRAQKSRFQSTLPMRGATLPAYAQLHHLQISIHTPHAGSDLGGICGISSDFAISIHTPHAGSDYRRGCKDSRIQDFNPHSPCGERPQRIRSGLPPADFNPHSPCGERQRLKWHFDVIRKISIHTPHAGSDPMSCRPAPSPLRFQSTLPMRGATSSHTRKSPSKRFQSTLPMRGATGGGMQSKIKYVISIHTPHAGSDDRI